MNKREADSPEHDADPLAGLSLGRVLITEDEITRRVAALGDEITRDYTGRPPLLIGVLKGAFVFMADLARAIRLPVEMDFMAVSSYGTATKTSGIVRIVKDLDVDLVDRHVLIVEDIVDSGLTLSYLRKGLSAQNPASLKTGQQRVDLKIPYVGFEIPPDFVVGYGLDVAEVYRNLREVRIMDGATS